MKKIKNLGLASLLIVTFFFTSCEKNDTTNVSETEVDASVTSRIANQQYEAVTAEEYKTLTPLQQEVVQKINAAVRALDAIDDDRFEATISISKDKSDTFSNAILLSIEKMNISTTAKAGKCSVCGLRSAYKCLTKMQDEITADEFDVHVKRVGKCVELSWK